MVHSDGVAWKASQKSRGFLIYVILSGWNNRKLLTYLHSPMRKIKIHMDVVNKIPWISFRKDRHSQRKIQHFINKFGTNVIFHK